MVLYNPLVSIIMTTYNTNPEYLKESISSILNQTYKEIEFIIVNDGTTSIDPKKIIDEFDDERIRYIDNKENNGITKCLNIALNNCNGKYIARMDDDDIAVINRIEKQVEFFEGNSEVNILGTNVKYFGTINKILNVILPLDREQQQIRFILGNYGIPHPSAMFRASFLKKYNIKYNEKYKKSQDYGMWVECSKYSRIDCLPEVLLNYRVHTNQISTKNKEEQFYYDELIKIDQLKWMGMQLSEKQIKTHLAFCRKDDNLNINETEKWIAILIKFNNQKNIFNRKMFVTIIKNHWIEICQKRLIKDKKIKYIFPLLKSINKDFLIEFSRRKIKNILE